jgi:hypothetical protein
LALWSRYAIRRVADECSLQQSVVRLRFLASCSCDTATIIHAIFATLVLGSYGPDCTMRQDPCLAQQPGRKEPSRREKLYAWLFAHIMQGLEVAVESWKQELFNEFFKGADLISLSQILSSAATDHHSAQGSLPSLQGATNAGLWRWAWDLPPI